jgi:hypothetical protein
MTQSVRETLTPKQEKAITALITSKTLEEAAQRTGCSPKTLYRWRYEDPLFETEFRHARRAALDGAIADLQIGASEAVLALRNALNDRSVSVRVRSAAILLEHALAAHQAFELEARIKQLEASQGEGGYPW